MNSDDELDPQIAQAMRAIRSDQPPSDATVARVMERVRARPVPRRSMVHLAAWQRAGLVLAAAAAAIAIVVWNRAPDRAPAAPPSAPANVREVRFTLDAPNVSRVAVAGDFSNWRPVELRREADGERWTVTLPIRAGRYTYAFVVDGSRWVTDPVAPVAPDADFGTTGSVLVVEGAGGAT